MQINNAKTMNAIGKHEISLPHKFAYALFGTIGGFCLGFLSPIIIPVGICFMPFAIYDVYDKNNYVVIKKELFDKKYK